MNKLLLAAAISIALPFTAHAGAEFVAGDATIAGEVELGATLTTGNTETSSFKTRLGLKHELENWENQYVFEGLYSEDTETITAKRYFFGAQGDYLINERNYLFINSNYESDPFTGYDFTFTSAAGYGYRFIDTDTMTLKAQAGPGYIYQQLDEPSALDAGYNSESSVVLHSVVDFQVQISTSSKFQQRLIADWGDKLDARSESSLTANIIGSLAMKFAVVVRYDSESLASKKSTDTETNMTLLYSF